jgi:hypothetical protein
MLALASIAWSAVSVFLWQRLNTDAEYEIVNAYRDGRLWILIVVIVIIAMLVKQRRKIG